MAVFDAMLLLYFLEAKVKVPTDPATGKPVTDAKARVDRLIQDIGKRNEMIVIPTPALSEVLVHADEARTKYLHILTTARHFRVEPFDQRAAVELATMTREAVGQGDLRAGMQMTRAKLKFDRQIIAIARTRNQTTIYSDDKHIQKLAEPLGIEVIALHDLPLPERPGFARRTRLIDLGDRD